MEFFNMLFNLYSLFFKKICCRIYFIDSQYVFKYGISSLSDKNFFL